jgi:hypothetical protein
MAGQAPQVAGLLARVVAMRGQAVALGLAWRSG